MTSHIHRGFHRIGVVLAAPPLLVAGWLFMQEVTRPSRPTGSFVLPSEAADVHVMNFTNVWPALTLSVVLYAAARAVGWVLAGVLSPRA